MPLRTHQIEPAQELPGIIQTTHAQRPQARPVRQRPGFDLGTRPGDIAIAQQRYQVIGYRAHYCILKIQHPGVIRRSDHQIARMIIAMHPDPGLLQGIIRQPGKRLIEHHLLIGIQRQAQQAPEEPLAKQLHFPVQQRRVIGRQQRRARIAASLQARQSLQGIAIEQLHGPGIKRAQVLARTQVAQQQQTLIEIPRQHLGRVQTQATQRGGDGDKWPAILLIRWRIHDDTGLAVVPDPEITTETGVTGRRSEAGQRRRQHRLQPDPQ